LKLVEVPDLENLGRDLPVLAGQHRIIRELAAASPVFNRK
jgi:hypothetical protein